MAVHIVLALLLWLLLWFMIRHPQRWSALVEKENDFWVSKGLVSASRADSFKRFEKGRGEKILVGIAAMLVTLYVILLIVGL